VKVVLEQIEGRRSQVEAGGHRRGERAPEVAFDVDVLREVRLEQADVAACHGRHQRRIGVEVDAER